MIKGLIDNAASYLSTCWPLQQFVALNPLWEKKDKPIALVQQELAEKVKFKGCLELKELYHRYSNKEFTQRDLESAIDKTSTIFQINDLTNNNELKEIFIRFLLDKSSQAALLEFAAKASHNPENLILISNQIKEYFFDNPMEWVSQQTLNYLNHHFSLDPYCWQQNSSKVLFKNWYTQIQDNSGRNKWLDEIPNSPEAAITRLFEKLLIPKTYRQRYIFEILWQLKGWASYNRWLLKNPDNPWAEQQGCLASIVALWLAYEYQWVFTHSTKLKNFSPFKPKIVNSDKSCSDLSVEHLWQSYLKKQGLQPELSETKINLSLIQWLWQTAWELNLHQKILMQLQAPSVSSNSAKATLAQWVFCIDTRSEGIRRHLEAQAHFETYGFAGFFGVAFQLKDSSNNSIRWQSPALLRPTEIVNCQHAQNSFIHSSLNSLNSAISAGKNHLVAPFALFELLGLWCSLKLMAKNVLIAPLASLKKKILKAQHHQPCYTLDLGNIEIIKATDIAESLLKTIGLVNHFSPWVFICGHTASSENNPYQAALDCGACGGNSGYINAEIICNLLNQSAVRSELSKRGICIPSTTKFVAACHNTTLDEIEWFIDKEKCSSLNLAELSTIKKSTQLACKALRSERLKTLPGNSSLVTRAHHWAELIPEWGLINNFAFIIGPRSLSSHTNLQRRVFLHSYEPSLDPDGKILESILLAPLIVAHWINSQYYFSTTDPEIYGSGNKTLHNLTSGLGVMLGNMSDLQLGLPSQSVAYRGKNIHEARRLFAIVYAKTSLVKKIIADNPLLQQLIDGQWIFLHTIEASEHNATL